MARPTHRWLSPLPLLGMLACTAGDKGRDGADAGGDRTDLDGDGYAESDCDDDDATVHPGAADVWYDGVDSDCRGDSDYDADADGHDATRFDGDDCDDQDSEVSPSAQEIWYDGVDQDCSGGSDYDLDEDGYPSVQYDGLDCDDRDASVNPAAVDAWYDGIDQDCRGDNDYDADVDGFDAADHGGTDCDDADAQTNPGAQEVWYDGVDADCAGDSDYDADADGHDADDHGGGDCDDQAPLISPSELESCDDVDNDCDGEVDEEDAVDGPCLRVLEDFEAGLWPATGWTPVGTNNGLVTTTAYEGSYALYDSSWAYNDGVSVGSGTIIGMWVYVPTANGRVYLGFDSTAGGTRSFVVAPNTGDIRFQTNVGYAYVEGTVAPTAIPRRQWLYMELELTSATQATGRLYTSAGVLVDSVSHTYATPVGGGGVAVQSFSGISMDYITVR